MITVNSLKKFSYLGMIITVDGIKPDVSRVDATKVTFFPKTIRQLQQLVGYLNWHRPFIPKICYKLKSFTDKLKGNIKFKFHDQDMQVLKDIHKDIVKETLSYHPIYSSANNPTSNGISERINKIIKEGLRIYKGENITIVMGKIILGLNIFYNKTIGTSPYELVYKKSWY